MADYVTGTASGGAAGTTVSISKRALGGLVARAQQAAKLPHPAWLLNNPDWRRAKAALEADDWALGGRPLTRPPPDAPPLWKAQWVQNVTAFGHIYGGMSGAIVGAQLLAQKDPLTRLRSILADIQIAPDRMVSEHGGWAVMHEEFADWNNTLTDWEAQAQSIAFGADVQTLTPDMHQAVANTYRRIKVWLAAVRKYNQALFDHRDGPTPQPVNNPKFTPPRT